MNAANYAKHRQVTPSQVTAWIKKGLLGNACQKVGARYVIDPVAADAALEGGLHPSYDPGDTGPSFAEARRQKEHHLAELRRLELEEKKGMLVPAAEVQGLLEKLIMQARTRLLGIKAQVAPLVHEAIADAAQRERLLFTVEEIIEGTLKDLSDAKIQ
ncbi:hypothetical protein [Desulfatitalea tepidiphila]|uniref:hypothetical protein n=1 Tax=Desulfatitalea tepidiphila TaxID=1185843 RepID=UPI0006B446E4|nr:hypothetical protein [Desulfatitalea tepidiphila]